MSAPDIRTDAPNQLKACMAGLLSASAGLSSSNTGKYLVSLGLDVLPGAGQVCERAIVV